MAPDPKALIQGLVYTEQAVVQPGEILLLVESEMKSGKSCLATTLFDWPNEGDRPFVIAVDPTGPESCATLGRAVAHVKVKDRPGNTFKEKMDGVVANLQNVYELKRQKPFSSIVVDCASTLAECVWRDNAGLTNGKQRHGVVLEECVNWMHKLRDLGVPIIFLCWVRESHIEESGSKQAGTYSKKTSLGGPQIRGSFKHQLAGAANMVLLMEKLKAAGNDPDRDSDNYKRLFHTRTYNLIECGGRCKLPEPMPANLGLVLAMMTGQIENPATKGLVLTR